MDSAQVLLKARLRIWKAERTRDAWDSWCQSHKVSWASWDSWDCISIRSWLDHLSMGAAKATTRLVDSFSCRSRVLDYFPLFLRYLCRQNIGIWSFPPIFDLFHSGSPPVWPGPEKRRRRCPEPRRSWVPQCGLPATLVPWHQPGGFPKTGAGGIGKK